jgi:hypothetical protein
LRPIAGARFAHAIGTPQKIKAFRTGPADACASLWRAPAAESGRGDLGDYAGCETTGGAIEGFSLVVIELLSGAPPPPGAGKPAAM